LGEGHLFDHDLAEDLSILSPASVEQHLRKDGKVICRGEKAGMTGNATHPESGWIVNFSNAIFPGGCDPVKQG
jgi:hypothetical protein